MSPHGRIGATTRRPDPAPRIPTRRTVKSREEPMTSPSPERRTERVRSRGSGRSTLAHTLLWSERALLVIGVACLAVYGAACASRTVYQAVEVKRFDDAIRHALEEERHDHSEWSSRRVDAFEASRVRPVEALARLEIPDADVSVMVLDGTDEATLDRAVGHIPGTARPGETGNLGIAGHRDGFFRGLRHLETGDEITLATLEGVTRYRVSDLRIVRPEDVEVLDPTPDPVITLVTCYPFYYVGSAPQRFIVRGERVAFEPWTTETAAAYLGNDLAQR
jgi:sortase A